MTINVNKKYFLISDIHNNYVPLFQVYDNLVYNKKLFKNDKLPMKDEYNICLLGDYTDGGIHAKEVVSLLLNLNKLSKQDENINITMIKGNHDQFILNFVKQPDFYNYELWTKNGGKKTIRTLFPDTFISRTNLKCALENTYSDYLKLLNDMPLLIENDKLILVHAGLDLTKKDYHETSKQDMLWLRDEYLFNPSHTNFHENTTNKIIISGHTPTFSFMNSELELMKINMLQKFNSQIVKMQNNNILS